jgi:Tol biopolymer transport system component
MKKRAALIAFLAVLHFTLLGLATALGQSTPLDILAFTTSEQRIPCGAAVRPFNIAIMDIGHHLLCNLTGMEGHAIFAGWSPDGTRVAVEAGGTVYIADSHMREVARFEQSYSPSWSVNGTLVFRNLVGNIFTFDQNGENRQFLSTDRIRGYSPTWLPNGTRVVFFGEREVWMVDADGENLRTVTESSDPVELNSESFSNGEILIFQGSSMYIVDNETEQMWRVLRDYAIVSEPEFSFDGQQVAFLFDDEATHVGARVVNTTDGSDLLLFLDTPSYSLISSRIAWSPDGSWLAFDSDRGIHLADLITSSVRHICENCDNPVWVPDLALYAMIAEP